MPANEGQQRAINLVEGPVLITAGPGTGKTYTLVARVVHLVRDLSVAPSEVMVVTYTKKASQELTGRISDALPEVNVSEMWVGTFHALCLRLMKEFPEHVSLAAGFRLAGEYTPKDLVWRNLDAFRALPHYSAIERPHDGDWWKEAENIITIADGVVEELIDENALAAMADAECAAAGEVTQLYRKLLKERNLLDYATLEAEALRMLEHEEGVLEEMSRRVRYVMVDEYQDTNLVQERLALCFAGPNTNLCVVGDDDQALYRFRGATVRNILEFPENIGGARASLSVNYRSLPGIVDFYTDWMEPKDGRTLSFAWDRYRLDKQVVAERKAADHAPVVRVTKGPAALASFVYGLKANGTITDYNQVAVLLNSVKGDEGSKIISAFEAYGIPTYAPRAKAFSERHEVKLMYGLLLLAFPNTAARVEYGKNAGGSYEMEAASLARGHMAADGRLTRNMNIILDHHRNPTTVMPYAISGLIERLCMYEPFRSILLNSPDGGFEQERAARNLGKFASIAAEYELEHGIDHLTPENIVTAPWDFLMNAFPRRRVLVDEYEDPYDGAPTGHVSFMTFHQAKGTEFPVVVVGSMKNWIGKRRGVPAMMQRVRDRAGARGAFESEDDICYFDFWRLYYVAFSRARDLLVIEDAPPEYNRRGRLVRTNRVFQPLLNKLPEARAASFAKIHIEEHVPSAPKRSFSFTSDVAAWIRCPVRYKLVHEYQFPIAGTTGTTFGSLVHETIEDVNRAALAGNPVSPEDARVAGWLDANRRALSLETGEELSDVTVALAQDQVEAYIEHRGGHWDDIVAAEVDVTLARPDYLIKGTIDLVKREDGRITLVDFKTGRKPDAEHAGLLDTYRKQLLLYAAIVEEREHVKVDALSLYYTGDMEPVLEIERTDEAIDGVCSEFDHVVKKILVHDFHGGPADPAICSTCEFCWVCGKVGKVVPKRES